MITEPGKSIILSTPMGQRHEPLERYCRIKRTHSSLFCKVPVIDASVSESQTIFDLKTSHVLEGNSRASLSLKINQAKNGAP